MKAIDKPQGTYKGPSRALARCPHCNGILNHHLMPDAQADYDQVITEGVIDLSQDAPPAPSPGEATQEEIDSGDIYVESPRLIRTPDQVKTGQHRPDKGLRHTIPGMPVKEQVPESAQPPPHRNASGLTVLDNPIIGGRVTICVLLYGKEHEALHRRCLNSIVHSVPPSRMDLRVACNQVGEGTLNYLQTLPVSKVYRDDKNRRKYPAMREMFWDKEKPIETNYVIWFDDDSYARREDWLSVLGQTIVAQRPSERVGMYGAKFYHPLKLQPDKDPRDWFRSAKWWKGKGFQNKQGRAVPNGDKIHFAVGGFWCISLQAIRDCDIPDRRLNHNGGDICIGAQVLQQYKIKSFNEKKQYIHTSAAPRRGFHEKFPWYR